MTRNEHLLNQGVEEALEVAHRLSKALRFGMQEIQPEQLLTNRQRIVDEFTDLVASMEMIGIYVHHDVDRYAIEKKKKKIEKYLLHAEACGTLNSR